MALIHGNGPIYASRADRAAPFVAEFLGTFLVTMTVLVNGMKPQGSDATWNITSNAFMVVAISYACSHISGANLNPSVSIALLLSGRQLLSTFLWLTLVQLLGAACAGALCYSVSDTFHVQVGPLPGHTWMDVAVIEVFYTAMLCFVYLNCAASSQNNPVKDPNGFVGLSVGFCYIAAGYAANAISVTALNPAIAIGLEVVVLRNGFTMNGVGLLFWDVLGAFIAVGAYRLVRPQDFVRADSIAHSISMERKRDDTPLVAAEFLGTFGIVFTKALNTLTVGTKNGQKEGPDAWSVAAAVCAMAFSLRTVSGAHFNPTVTMSVWLTGRGGLPTYTAILYCLTQVLAGVCATAAAAMVGQVTDGSATGFLVLRPNQDYSIEAVHLSEFIFSFLTSYVVVSTTVNSDSTIFKTSHNNFAPFAYGACITAAGFAIGNVSGSVLNPATVIGFNGISSLMTVSGGDSWHYILYEAGGALLATLAFIVTHPAIYFAPTTDSSD